MKSTLLQVLIALIAITTALGAGVRSNYPRVSVTPSPRIIEGDTVHLRLTLAQGTSSCVPTYPDVSFAVEQQPEEIYPPNFKVNLSYTAVPPNAGGICLTVMTDYGPQFTFTGLREGAYTCLDKTNGGAEIATFRVFKNDSMQYAVTTLKSLYSKGQDLDVAYTMKNNATHFAKFDFSSSCQFDMTLRTQTGRTFYHYMEKMACGGVLSDITLQPSEEKKYVFPVFGLDDAYGPVTITAQMIGYEESAAAKTITVNQTTESAGKRAPALGMRRCAWHPNTGTLSVWLDHTQSVAFEVFLPDGRTMKSWPAKRFLPAGLNVIPIDRYSSVASLILVRITGEEFSVSMKIVNPRHP